MLKKYVCFGGYLLNSNIVYLVISNCKKDYFLYNDIYSKEKIVLSKFVGVIDVKFMMSVI